MQIDTDIENQDESAGDFSYHGTSEVENVLRKQVFCA